MSKGYFNGYKNFIWSYEDEFSVICLGNGNTIIYVEELKEIIRKMSDQGLPPLSALILAIASLKGNYENIKWIEEYLQYKAVNEGLNYKDTIDFLKLLSQVNPAYKSGHGRLILLSTIFNKCHGHLSLSNSASISSEFCKPGYVIKPEVHHTTLNLLNKAIKPIHTLKKKFPTTESIEDKLQNIPILEDELLFEEIDSEDFEEQLIANPATRKIGLLVNRITSGINIPIHSSEAAESNLGGISGLLNKGNYDQLLLSEYAYDDLTFLLRLSNNEALFLSKEKPPSTSNKRRVLLIDVSILSWGTPKLIALAEFISIYKHPKNKFETIGFTVGEDIKPIDLDTVKSFTKSLFHVDMNLTCSSGIEDYFLNHHSKDDDVYYLGDKRALSQPNMLTISNKYKDLIKLWILNDSNGSVDIYKGLKNSKKHIQHIELPLKPLWDNGIRQKSGVYHKSNIPILVDIPQRRNAYKSTDNGEIYLLTKERSLLRFYNKYNKFHQSGWQILLKDLPLNEGIYEVGKLLDGTVQLLISDVKNKAFHIFKLNSGRKKTFSNSSFKMFNTQKLLFLNDAFFIETQNACYKVSFDSGIEETQKIDHKEFISREKVSNEIFYNELNLHDVIKNVKHIGISKSGCLIVNKHKLILNEKNEITFIKYDSYDNLVQIAYSTGNNMFEFSNGYKVQANLHGYIVLIKPTLPNEDVFIPVTINSKLGLATQSYYTGDKYFINQELFDIQVLDTGPQRLAAVKTIKLKCDIGLKHAKEIIYNHNSFKLDLNASYDECVSTLNDLTAVGIKAEIVNVNLNSKNLVEMTTDSFFNKYIDTFNRKILMDEV